MNNGNSTNSVKIGVLITLFNTEPLWELKTLENSFCKSLKSLD